MKTLKVLGVVFLVLCIGFLAVIISCLDIEPAQKTYTVEKARKAIEEVCKDFINYDITAEECQAALEEIDLTHSIERADGYKKADLKQLNSTKQFLIDELDNPDGCGFMSGFWLAYYEDIVNF